MSKKVIIWIIVIIIALILVFSLKGGKNDGNKSTNTSTNVNNQTGLAGEKGPETTGTVIDDELLDFTSTQEEDDSVTLSDEALASEPAE